MAVIAVVVVFGALGGGAYATVTLITNAQIADNTITGAKIHNGSLTLKDLDSHARAALTGKRGPAGRRGLTGRTGATGAAGIGGQAGAAGLQGPAGPAAHAPFEAADVTMAPGDAPRTITTQGGVAIVMSCAAVNTPGWAWGTSANVTATTDIGAFTLANGMADQLLIGGLPDPDAEYPYDFTGSFLEFWTGGGTIVRSFGHLEISQNACSLSDFRGVVYA
jgi:hypothetical protein